MFFGTCAQLQEDGAGWNDADGSCPISVVATAAVNGIDPKVATAKQCG